MDKFHLKSCCHKLLWISSLQNKDKLLEEFTLGYVHCGLLDHTEKLYCSVFEPTMIQFATLPHRIYLKHLSKIHIGGKRLPFVQNCFKSRNEKGGRWLQGSLVYTFSRPIAGLCLKLQGTAKVRKLFKKVFKK